MLKTKKFLILLLSSFVFMSCSNNKAPSDSSISEQQSLEALFDNTHTVYETDSLDSLKPFLTVKYTNEQGSTSQIGEYSLQGTLKAGTCQIIVSYNNLSASVWVNVISSGVDNQEPHYVRRVNTYEPVQLENELEFRNSINLSDEYYLYYFELGTLLNCPIYSSCAMQYSYDTEVELSFEKITEESFEHSVDTAKREVDLHSYSGGFDVNVKAGVEYKPSFLGIPIGGLKFSASAEISTDHHWTSEWGSEVYTSDRVVEKYLNSYKIGYEETIDFSEEAGFSKGKYYRISFFEPLTVYGILIYDVNKNEYEVSYQTTMQENSQVRVIEESDSPIFEYTNTNDKLYFDLNKAIDYAENNKPDDYNNQIVIDLTPYYQNNDVKLSNFKHDLFNNDTGVFTAYGAYKNVKVTSYKFVGSYGMPDSNGKIINTNLENFSIEIASDSNMTIEFENMNFIGANDKSAIYRSEDTSYKGLNDNIYYSGVGGNIITAGKPVDNLDAQSVINLQNITLSGAENSSLKLIGQDGLNGKLGDGYDRWHDGASNRNGSNGTNGGQGSNGIECNSLTISDTINLQIVSGNGGTGGSGGNGGGSNDSGTARAGHGGRGGDGGVGGSAILLSGDLKIKNTSSQSNITLTSGRGGNGGQGGHGGHGLNKNTKDSGGNGGAGGNGGNSGYCIYANNVETNINIDLISGNGGQGGQGGSGGNAYRDSVHGSRTYIGNGGRGGDGGNCIIVNNSQFTTKLNLLSNVKAGDGGQGGQAGGGAEGVGAIHFGTSGAGGNSGYVSYGINKTSVQVGNEGTSGLNATGGQGGKGETLLSYNS